MAKKFHSDIPCECGSTEKITYPKPDRYKVHNVIHECGMCESKIHIQVMKSNEKDSVKLNYKIHQASDDLILLRIEKENEKNNPEVEYSEPSED